MRYSEANMIGRRGFSLVELLVVMAIIAVLFGLAAGATMQVITVQRDSTTKTALQTLDKTLRAHWEYVTKEAAKEEPSPAVLALANNDPARAKVLWIKLRQTEAFPQCYDEVKVAMAGGGIYGPFNDPSQRLIPVERRKYMKIYWAAIMKTINPTFPNEYLSNPLAESAACLYLALTINRGSKLDEANLAGSIVDTDNDGIKELIDGFGKPIRFQRFLVKPTDAVTKAPYYYTIPALVSRISPAMEAALPVELAKAQDELATMNKRGDPIDAEGTLRQQIPAIFKYWCYSDNGIFFAAVCNMWFPSQSDAAFFPDYFALVNNVDALSQPYFMPHLISSGRDEVPFTDDDVYSFRLLRVGS